MSLSPSLSRSLPPGSTSPVVYGGTSPSNRGDVAPAFLQEYRTVLDFEMIFATISD